MINLSELMKIKELFKENFAVTALSATIGALVTFMMTSYFEDTNREVSSRPYLNVDINTLKSDQKHYGVRIQNSGQGPAIVDKFSFYFGSESSNEYMIGKQYNSYFIDDFIQKANLEEACSSVLYVERLPKPGYSIQKDDEIGVLILRPIDSNDNEAYNLDREMDENAKHQMMKEYNRCRASFINAFKTQNIYLEIHYHSINNHNFLGKETVYGVGEKLHLTVDTFTREKSMEKYIRDAL